MEQHSSEDIQPLKAVCEVIYDPQGYLDECSEFDTTPSKEGFFQWVTEMASEDLQTCALVDLCTPAEILPAH